MNRLEVRVLVAHPVGSTVVPVETFTNRLTFQAKQEIGRTDTHPPPKGASTRVHARPTQSDDCIHDSISSSYFCLARRTRFVLEP